MNIKVSIIHKDPNQPSEFSLYRSKQGKTKNIRDSLDDFSEELSAVFLNSRGSEFLDNAIAPFDLASSGNQEATEFIT